MRTIQEIVDRPDWQQLRAALVGTWKHVPEDNVQKLRVFLGPIRDGDYDKLRIVHNYLTGSAFRLGIIHHPAITQLLEEVRYERERCGWYNCERCKK